MIGGPQPPRRGAGPGTQRREALASDSSRTLPGHWLRHGQDLISRELHVVDLAGVLLHLRDKLVIGFLPDYLAAVAGHLFRRHGSPSFVRVRGPPFGPDGKRINGPPWRPLTERLGKPWSLLPSGSIFQAA